MPDLAPFKYPIDESYSVLAAGVHRDKHHAVVVADLALFNGRVLHAASGVLTDPDGRRAWATAARTTITTPDGPSVERIIDVLMNDVLFGALELLRQPTRKPPRPDGESPYEATPGGIVWNRPTASGVTTETLANFTATITEDVTADDGASQRREVVITGVLAGRPLPPLRVPVKRFASLEWVSEWGPDAIVGAGFGTKDRLREAIQRLSPAIVRRHVYEHPGWRQIPGCGWVFLHAGGGIGAHGLVPDLTVSLSPQASGIVFPEIPSGEALRARVRACLDLIDLAPEPVTAPTFGAVYRAALGEMHPADLTVYLLGSSGVYKSELQALAQQHVGAGFHRLNLPANWTWSANALEKLAFEFKDCPLVIDDFVPSGTAVDVAKLHATAERVIRGAGNRSGRGRMHADGSLRPVYPPRGVILSSGEDIPKGHSLRARMVISELATGDVDPARLTAARDAAARGVFAGGMGGFVRHLAAHFEEVRASIPSRLAAYRANAHQSAAHARTPDAVANLALGWRVFLDFAAEIGAVAPAEGDETFARIWAALGEAARQQASHQETEEPAQRFVTLLQSALAGGFAHVAAMDGTEPGVPEAWGWRKVTSGSGGSGLYERTERRAQGTKIGWLDGEDLYLDLGASLAATHAVASASGGGITVTPKTLMKRLHERRLLASIDEQRDELQIRRTVEGARRRVVHLLGTTIMPTESAQSAQDEENRRQGVGVNRRMGGF